MIGDIGEITTVAAVNRYLRDPLQNPIKSITIAVSALLPRKTPRLSTTLRSHPARLPRCADAIGPRSTLHVRMLQERTELSPSFSLLSNIVNL